MTIRDMLRTLSALGLAMVLATGQAVAQGTTSAVFTVGATVASCCVIAAGRESITLACTKSVFATVNVASGVPGDGDDPVWRPVAHRTLSVDSAKVPVTIPSHATTPTVVTINF
jgi:hypothetical protein